MRLRSYLARSWVEIKMPSRWAGRLVRFIFSRFASRGGTAQLALGEAHEKIGARHLLAFDAWALWER